MHYSEVRFPKKDNRDFVTTLNKRVRTYFKENNLSQQANTEMKVKTVIMISLYIMPYIILVSGLVTTWYEMLACYALMGIGVAGIGLSVMHDANHGSYSKKPWVNNLLGHTLNMMGGDVLNWKLQHNVLHHTYTNVEGIDDDISPGKILRLNPHGERLAIHKYQYIYGWFLYSMITFSWIIMKDIKQVLKYKKIGLMDDKNYGLILTKLISTKLIYLAYVLVLPMYLLDIHAGAIFGGFMLMHFIGGLSLGAVFQPAHVMEGAEYQLPDDEGNMENAFAIHQLKNTCNFALKNKPFTWFVGGLNYQIEHHLFPNVCHVHYPHISPIVQETAKEFNVPYYEHRHFRTAIADHTKMLYKFGRN